MKLKFFNPEQDPEMVGVDYKLMYKLDLARQMADIPFIITSGLRSIEKNKEIGGASDSSHLKGLAVDIACKNSQEAYCIIKGAFMAGFERIGLGKGHIHLDTDPIKTQKVLFVE